MKGNTKVMLSVLIFHEDKILLNCIGNRVTAPSWAAVGKRFEQEALDGAKKSMIKDLGIMASDFLTMELRYATMRYKDGEIRQNYFYFATTNYDMGIGPIGNMKWIPVAQLPEMELPKNLESVLKHYLAVGQKDHKVYGGIMKEKGFAITELEEF